MIARTLPQALEFLGGTTSRRRSKFPPSSDVGTADPGTGRLWKIIVMLSLVSTSRTESQDLGIHEAGDTDYWTTFPACDNLKQNLHSVVPGAALVAFLWIVAARLLSLYLSQFNPVNLLYGSLGSVIAALLFSS